MEAPTQNFINKIAQIAKKELELRTLILEPDTLYNGDPNWAEWLALADGRIK